MNEDTWYVWDTSRSQIRVKIMSAGRTVLSYGAQILKAGSCHNILKKWIAEEIWLFTAGEVVKPKWV